MPDIDCLIPCICKMLIKLRRGGNEISAKLRRKQGHMFNCNQLSCCDCISYYTKMLNNCKSSSFYSWASDNGADGPELLLLLLLPFLLGPLAWFPSEFIWKYESFRQSVWLLGRGISQSQGRYLHRTTRTQKKTDIHASSGLRTHDPSVCVGEDISCLWPCGDCDRRAETYKAVHTIELFTINLFALDVLSFKK
jgi:hypothetical protein